MKWTEEMEAKRRAEEEVVERRLRVVPLTCLLPRLSEVRQFDRHERSRYQQAISSALECKRAADAGERETMWGWDGPPRHARGEREQWLDSIDDAFERVRR